MTWILIGLVLLVAFGPVLWLVPSKRDKRLAALRARGRVEGLVVELRRLPKLDPTPADRVSSGGKVRSPTIECAAYSYAMARKLKYLPAWRVLRVDIDQQPDPLAHWRYDQRPQGEGRRYLSQMLELTGPVLEKLPGDVAAVEIGDRMLMVYWLEKPGSTEQTVSEIAGSLRELEALLSGLDEQISENLRNDDS